MKSLQRFLTLLLVVIAIAPLGYAVGQRWPEFTQVLQELNWELAVGSQVQFLVVILLMGAVPWASLRSLGMRLPPVRAIAVYFLSQALKYLPGGFWAIPGRVALYTSLGFDLPRSVVSVFRETTAIYLGAALVALMGVFLDVSMSPELKTVIVLGIAVSTIIIILTHIPRIWGWLSKLRVFARLPFAAYQEIESNFANMRWLPRALFVSVVFWILLGIPFQGLVEAVTQSEDLGSWLAVSSLFATAWCAGFVIVIVPAGIGVREGVLTLLLSFSLTRSEALSVAVLSRLWWILAESVWIIGAVLLLAKDMDISSIFHTRKGLQSIRESDNG